MFRSNLEEGIEGEYWKYVGETNLAFTKNKLYKVTNFKMRIVL